MRAADAVRRIGEVWRDAMAGLRPRWLTDHVLRGMRWGCTVLWALAFARQCYVDGLPLYRSDLLVWVVVLLAALSIGKRGIFTILIDFFPFAAVLVAYDYLRGFADTVGMPTWWHPQIDVDKFLFFGNEPTVWLQEHLKHPDVRWYDIVVGCVTARSSSCPTSWPGSCGGAAGVTSTGGGCGSSRCRSSGSASSH